MSECFVFAKQRPPLKKLRLPRAQKYAEALFMKSIFIALVLTSQSLAGNTVHGKTHC